MPIALIVDDNPQDAYLLRCLLEADGYDVVEARNGREALEQARARHMDLVVSDILMPVMDGFSLCRQWRGQASFKDIPFIFYTATYVDRRDEELALSLGADLFLVKPAEPDVLRQSIAATMAKYRAGRPPSPVVPDDETPYLQQYNAVLIHKLEDKLLQLERANHELRMKDLALASAANGIVLATPVGTITYVNPVMARLCGATDAELIGRQVTTLFANAGAVQPWLRSELPPGPTELELASASRRAEGAWVQVTGNAVLDDGGARVGVMLSCLNVTEARRLRQDLARVQRFEALGLFAAGVAHDFNNLLMAIYAGLDLGGGQQHATADRDRQKELALAAFERARELTARLLTFSKGSTSSRRTLDLRQLLDETLSLALGGSPVGCEKRYDPTLPSAVGDPGQLAQVFTNLVVNARQAMNDRGTIVVSAAAVKLEAGAVLPPGEYVRVAVEDDGPGIPPDVLPRVFEPFFTTKRDGSGLGLATSLAIVEDHGGHLSVSTRLGAGTRFEVLVPASSEAASATRRAVPALDPTASGRILVMDDQDTIRELVRRGLERAGYSVVVTAGGEQALVELERARAGGQPFDLLLLDITVPGGMGGTELLARVRLEAHRTPAVAMTGYSDHAVREELLAHGFALVLPKPFLMHELTSSIAAVLTPEAAGPGDLRGQAGAARKPA